MDQRGELDADLYLLPLHRTRYTHVLMDRWWLQWTNTTVPYPCQTHVHTIALKSTTLAGTTTVFVGVPKSVGNPVFAGAPATFLRSLPVSLKLGILCPRESRLSGGSSFARLCDLGGNLKDTGRPYACTHAPTTHSPHGPFRPSPAHLDAKVADWSDRTKAEYAFVRSYQPSTCCQMCMPFWHDTPSRLPLGPTSSGRQMSKVDRIQLGFGTVRHINQVIRQGHATRRRKVMGNGRSRRHAHAPTEQTKKQTETDSKRPMYGHTGSVQSRNGFKEFAKAREGSHQPGSEGTRAHVSHHIEAAGSAHGAPFDIKLKKLRGRPQ